MIDITNLKIQYREIELEYPDYQIQENSITCISGKNGSGKTSLLKAIANLVTYTGNITKSDATFVSQAPVMFRKTIYENITYPLRIRKMNIKEFEKEINDYISTFELESLQFQDASLCSSGEQMKASIIRAVIFRPKVLLLDEPTTALDIDSINRLTTLLLQLKSTMTIIISSHDRRLIEEISDYHIQLGDSHV